MSSENSFSKVPNEVVHNIIDTSEIYELVALAYTDVRLRKAVTSKIGIFKRQNNMTDDDFMVYLWMKDSSFWRRYAGNASMYAKLEMTIAGVVNNKKNDFVMPENRFAPLIASLNYGDADDVEDYFLAQLRREPMYNWNTFRKLPGEFVMFSTMVFDESVMLPTVENYVFFLTRQSPFVSGEVTKNIYLVASRPGFHQYLMVSLANHRGQQLENHNRMRNYMVWLNDQISSQPITQDQMWFYTYVVICRKSVPQQMANRIFNNIQNNIFPEEGDVWDELYSLC